MGAFAKPVRTAAAAALIALAAFAGPAVSAQADAGRGVARIAIDRDFLIGSWTDAGDCSVTVAFVADGTFATAEGDGGTWSLSGDTLTLTGAAGSRSVTLIPIDRDTMEVVGENGAHDRTTRCAGDLFDARRFA
ncbi:MAG TPA: hypothetical protein VMS43_07255 [Allosphingosinicella sp.]|nr:hypothetical protein [Allosphingosinicella sp.]